MVADHFYNRSQGYSEDQPHRSPHKTPEQQRHGERQGVQSHTPANQRGNQQIGSEDMKHREHRKDAKKRSDGVILLKPYEQWRNPGHDCAKVWDQVAQAGNQGREKREVETESPEEQPASSTRINPTSAVPMR